MSEKEFSAACSGDCSSCGSDCESRTTVEGGTTVTIQMDDGTTVECAILTAFEIDDKSYIVLLPLDENGMAESEEVFIYRYILSDNQTPTLENISDDEEYEKVAGAFEDYLQSVQAEAQFADLDDIVENESAN